jgi:hypothetical protein
MGSDVCSRYFHEKAGEPRHNKRVGYVMFLAGSVFFVGGINSVEYEWRTKLVSSHSLRV